MIRDLLQLWLLLASMTIRVFSEDSDAHYDSNDPTHASHLLSTAAKNNISAPRCADEIQNLCPDTYYLVRDDFWMQGSYTHESEARQRTCAWWTTNTTCPHVCRHGTDPAFWLSYVMSFCDDAEIKEINNFTLDYSELWLDYQNYADLTRNAFVPWSWRLVYNASSVDANRQETPPECPSRHATLLAFGVVNIVMLFVDLILVRRPVVNALTCRLFGNPDSGGKNTWILFGIASAILGQVANVVNALITRAAPGYSQVPIGELVLLWSARPRLAWIVVGMSGWGSEDRTYTSAAMSALLAELILQPVGAVYMGKTLNYARTHHYLGLEMWQHMPLELIGAHWMYVGAILYLAFVGFIYIGAYFCLRDVQDNVSGRNRHVFRYDEYTARKLRRYNDPWRGGRKAVWFVLLMIVPYLGQWLFWVGFVMLLGDNFCPPRLWTNTGVWAAFSTIGVMLGSF